MRQKVTGLLEAITFDPRKVTGRTTYQIKTPFKPYSMLPDGTRNPQFSDLKIDV